MAKARNVLNSPLESCGTDPMTGFYRNGCCDTGAGDMGIHVVCAEMTAEFLAFSAERGNDLSVLPRTSAFPASVPAIAGAYASSGGGSYEAGVAPPVNLAATHMSALEFVSLEELQEHAVEV